MGLRPLRDHPPGAGAAQVIDKGIATAGLLAQVLVAKYADHLPLYRQEHIFARGLCPAEFHAGRVGRGRLQPLVDALRQEILSHEALHADETPLKMLKPCNKKTHHAYLWAYARRLRMPYLSIR